MLEAPAATRDWQLCVAAGASLPSPTRHLCHPSLLSFPPQGLCAGGEVAGVHTYISEGAHTQGLGVAVSLISFTNSCAAFLAAAAVVLCTLVFGERAMEQWAWRVCFWAAVVPSYYCIRRASFRPSRGGCESLAPEGVSNKNCKQGWGPSRAPLIYKCERRTQTPRAAFCSRAWEASALANELSTSTVAGSFHLVGG